MGRVPSRGATPPPTLTPPPQLSVVVQSATLSEAIHTQGVRDVWVVVELAGGRLLSSTTPRVPVPKVVGRPLSFASAPPAVLTLQGKVTADLVKIMRSPDLSDSDLIFSLFGAAESSSSSAFYLGEAYVNLQECVRERTDVHPGTPLTLIGSGVDGSDVTIGSISVSVKPVSALLQLLETKPARKGKNKARKA